MYISQIKIIKTENLDVIFRFSIIILILAHLTSREFFPYGIINSLGSILLFLVFIISNIYFKSRFSYVMIILILSHFNFWNEAGGVFNIIAALIFFTYYFFNKKIFEQKHSDPIIDVCIVVLIINNIIGWVVKGNYPYQEFLVSIFTFSSYIILFYLSKSLFLNKLRIKIFIYISVIMMCYSMLIALINGFNIFTTASPLQYYNSRWIFEFKEIRHFFSMIGRTSGEIGLLMSMFLLPIYLSSYFLKEVQINKRLIIVGIFASAFLSIGSFSKTSFLLISLGIVIQLIVFSFFIRKALFSTKRFWGFILLILAVFFVLNSSLNFDYIFQRMNENPRFFYNFIKNPFIATGTSREVSFRIARETMQHESWFIGYGWAPQRFMKNAWLGEYAGKIVKYDLHNLYFSLPPIFGWIGSSAFIAIFIITLTRMYKIMRLYKTYFSIYTVLAVGFFFLFLFYLFSEFTICALSEPHYLMINMIWLGLANNVYYHYKKEISSKKI